MGLIFYLKKNRVVLQKNNKKVKFENKDYIYFLRDVGKINRRLKKKKDLFGETWRGFVILKRVINIGGIVLEAIQWEKVIAIW